jgi:hypothetical protein
MAKTGAELAAETTAVADVGKHGCNRVSKIFANRSAAAKRVSPAAQTLGCDRFVYNRLLEFEQKRYATDLTKTYKQDRDVELKRLKAEFPWLYEVNAQMLQQSKRKLDTLETSKVQKENWQAISTIHQRVVHFRERRANLV